MVIFWKLEEKKNLISRYYQVNILEYQDFFSNYWHMSWFHKNLYMQSVNALKIALDGFVN